MRSQPLGGVGITNCFSAGFAMLFAISFHMEPLYRLVMPMDGLCLPSPHSRYGFAAPGFKLTTCDRSVTSHLTLLWKDRDHVEWLASLLSVIGVHESFPRRGGVLLPPVNFGIGIDRLVSPSRLAPYPIILEGMKSKSSRTVV